MSSDDSRTPEMHCEDILAQVSDDMRHKYMAGQREHGGRMWRKDGLDPLWEELLDAMVYAHQARRQSMMAAHCLELALSADCPDEYRAGYTRKALNWLTVGNPEGITEPGA